MKSAKQIALDADLAHEERVTALAREVLLSLVRGREQLPDSLSVAKQSFTIASLWEYERLRRQEVVEAKQ